MHCGSDVAAKKNCLQSSLPNRSNASCSVVCQPLNWYLNENVSTVPIIDSYPKEGLLFIMCPISTDVGDSRMSTNLIVTCKSQNYMIMLICSPWWINCNAIPSLTIHMPRVLEGRCKNKSQLLRRCNDVYFCNVSRYSL